MADNVAITAGSGTSVATDDVGGVHYQKVKLALGANDAANLLAVGAGAVDTGTPRVTHASDDPVTTALQLIDDVIFTDDAVYTPATSKALVIGAQADEAAPDSVDEGDAGALRMTLARALHANIRNSSGTEVTFNANGQATMANSAPVVLASNHSNVPTAPAAQEVHLGEVGGKTVLKTITMTADTAIMAAADIIADTQQLDAAFRKADGTGVLHSMTVFDYDDNTAFAFDVYVHRTSTSMGTENLGITISDANAAAGIIGVVSFAATDAKDLINGRMYSKSNIGLPVVAVSGTDDLYFSVVNGSGTPTFAGGSIPIVVGILQD